MNILFLDDNLVRCKMFSDEASSAIIAYTAGECVAAMKFAPRDIVWDYVLLDHDLGKKNGCGMDVVEWIMENRPPVKQFIIHSHNVPAANRMVSLLQDAGYPCYHKPFCYKMGEELQ